MLLHRVVWVVLLVSGCASVKDAKDTVSGWLSDSTLSTKAVQKSAADSHAQKYAATLRIARYVDQRKSANPRLLGMAELPVRGIDGKQMLLDQEVADMVTTTISQRFDTAGFQVLEEGGKALFEVSGIIKDLTLNVKNRDEIKIGIETTLKEVATGKVLWSGLVTEKNDRFAGVSGNNRDDVLSYMNKSMRIVSSKTVEAVSQSLMAVKPELFNLTPGTKVIPGVTVFTAPVAATANPVAVPAPVAVTPAPVAVTPVPNAITPAPVAVTSAPVAITPAPVVKPAVVPVVQTATTPRAGAMTGLLLVNTFPARAKVYLDGVYFGLSPLRNEMEPGIYQISVKLEGYKMVTEKVSVRKGDNTEMELNLER